ncbi:MAG: hypothetical protein M1133_03650 [Armatimonadetes bacterium]|nr:hypothetical protein [Armatimonadota bacterium]
MRRALVEMKSLGFNTFCLDSKQSEDFKIRFDTGESSKFVSMQEYTMEVGREIGIGHMFLALYSCGDNLYWAGLRDSPPIYGEEAIGPNGEGMRTYKYWSPKAQDSMVEHCSGLLKTYRCNHTTVDGFADGCGLPIVTMWDPCLRPSFDQEGRSRYIAWLAEKYDGIYALNARYGTTAADFADLKPEDYWYKPESIDMFCQASPGEGDFEDETPDLAKWIDNQLWRVEETTQYFKDMQSKSANRDIPVYLMPCLQQWKIFLNDYGVDTSTAHRALDPWKIGQHVDSVFFCTLPADCHSRPNAYVVSAETSIARSANDGRDFVQGLCIIRYAQEDIFKHVSPAETVAAAAANGAKGIWIYGYNGVDDGGVFSKQPAAFKDSLRVGLEWFKAVVPQLDQPRTKEIAILFPLAMSILEPAGPGTRQADHRQDFLGWYQYLCNLGYMVDIVHPEQVKNGALRDYAALVIPIDTCYKHLPDEGLEAAIAAWINSGGAVVHGANCDVVSRIKPVERRMDDIEYVSWEPNIVPDAIEQLTYFQSEDHVALYESGRVAIACASMGEGYLYSCGFDPGYGYVKKHVTGVPCKYGVSEMYALMSLDPAQSPIADILGRHLKPRYCGVTGVEYAEFGDRVIVINHNPYPCAISEIDYDEAIWQYETRDDFLLPHSAAMLRRKMR